MSNTTQCRGRATFCGADDFVFGAALLRTFFMSVHRLEARDAPDECDEETHSQDGGSILSREHSPRGSEGGADAHPDGVSRADVDFFECEREATEANDAGDHKNDAGP